MHLHVRRTTPFRGIRLPALLLFGCGYMTPAFAYLDPGTGSIILQGLLAGIAAVVAAGGIFWQRIKAALRSMLTGRQPTDPAASRKPDE